MIDPIPLARRAEDRTDEDDGSGSATPWLNQPANSDTISALTEAELLQIAGKVGAIKSALIRLFDHPMSPPVKRLVRIALSNAEEAKTLAQAVLGSTRRG